MADVKTDSTLRAAVDQARAALDGIAERGTVGDHLEMVMDGERVATHYFACLATGYLGWRWSVSVARAPRQKEATVCETELVPGCGRRPVAAVAPVCAAAGPRRPQRRRRAPLPGRRPAARAGLRGDR